MSDFEIKSKVWVELDGQNVIGDGRYRLFRGIQEHGSLKTAAEKLGISYRHAWGQIKKLEKRLGLRLVEPRIGGRDGGGTVLTPDAEKLLDSYMNIRKEIEDFVEKKSGEFGI